MAGSDDPRDPAFEEARSNLKAALKSCRSVVRNYRELLTDDPAPAEPPQPSDTGDAD